LVNSQHYLRVDKSTVGDTSGEQLAVSRLVPAPRPLWAELQDLTTEDLATQTGCPWFGDPAAPLLLPGRTPAAAQLGCPRSSGCDAGRTPRRRPETGSGLRFVPARV
jgi:hypothetical protein